VLLGLLPIQFITTHHNRFITHPRSSTTTTIINMNPIENAMKAEIEALYKEIEELKKIIDSLKKAIESV